MGCPSACLVTSRYPSLPLSLDVVFQGDLKASKVPLSPQCKQEAINSLDKPVATVNNLPLAPPAVFGTTDNPLPFENIGKVFPEKYQSKNSSPNRNLVDHNLQFILYCTHMYKIFISVSLFKKINSCFQEMGTKTKMITTAEFNHLIDSTSNPPYLNISGLPIMQKSSLYWLDVKIKAKYQNIIKTREKRLC